MIFLGRTGFKKPLNITVHRLPICPQEISPLPQCWEEQLASFRTLPHSSVIRKLQLLACRPFRHETNINLGVPQILKDTDKFYTGFKVKGNHPSAYYPHWGHGWGRRIIRQTDNSSKSLSLFSPTSSVDVICECVIDYC